MKTKSVDFFIMGRMRRALRILSVALITAGIVVAIDVAATLLWKEPVSTVYGAIRQGEAEDSLAELRGSFAPRVDLGGGADLRVGSRKLRVLAAQFAEEVETGQGIGRIQIERIDRDDVFVEGTDTASLRKGPGHYSNVGQADQTRDDGSAFPGQGRTVGIAGHRTTYLAPFKRINEIRDGDEIVLEMPYATFTYRVQKHEIVDPGNIGVARDVGYDRLILTACHPLYSAAQRWVVFARLVDVEAVQPSSQPPDR